MSRTRQAPCAANTNLEVSKPIARYLVTGAKFRVIVHRNTFWMALCFLQQTLGLRFAGIHPLVRCPHVTFVTRRGYLAQLAMRWHRIQDNGRWRGVAGCAVANNKCRQALLATQGHLDHVHARASPRCAPPKHMLEIQGHLIHRVSELGWERAVLVVKCRENLTWASHFVHRVPEKRTQVMKSGNK